MSSSESSEPDRWDTPCGVHHGYVFLAGACFGALVVILVWTVMNL